MDPWKLLETGQPRKAIEAFTRMIRREPTDLTYAERAEAYIRLKEYDNALADLHCAIAVEDPTSTTYFERIGAVNWLARREYLAAATWLELVLEIERGKISYTDGAGGVGPGCLLWFAAVSLGYEELLVPARRMLESKVATGSGRNWTIENWPGPLAMFLLGSMDEVKLRKQISDVPITHEIELCQAEFYVAVRSLERGDISKATKDFRKAAALHAGSIENEYDLAQRESRRRDRGRTKRCT